MLRQGSEMAWVDEDEQVTLLHLPTGTYSGLADHGRRLWLVLLETGDLAETIDVLRAEYAAPAGALEADVQRTVAQWLADGWVEESAS